MWKNTDITYLDELNADSLWQAISSNIPQIATGSVYVALREKGRKSIEKWYEDTNWETAIKDIANHFYRRSNHNNIIEICLNYNYQNLAGLPPEDARGVLGARFSTDDSLSPKKTESFAPTTMIANNEGFEWVQRKYQKNSEWQEGENIYVDSFQSHQFIILVGEKTRIAKIYRGCQIVPLEKVNYENCKEFAFEMSEWIQRSISQNEGEEGKMLYMYWPTTYITDRSYSILRVLTIPYIELKSAKYFKDDIFHETATECLKYQIKKYYNDGKNFGYVSGGKQASIGEAAFLAMSILEHGGEEFREIEENLLKFTLHQQREDGSFETNYFPEDDGEDADDDYLFYPGETILYWSMRLKKYPDDKLLSAALKAIEFYKNWYNSQDVRNLFFISWQSQALCNLYEITKDESLYKYLIELNDYLLGYQQLENPDYPDLSGRFYDEEKIQPAQTANICGVFLSGTAKAIKIALDAGDIEKANKYRKHVISGIRSMMQNAIADDIDCFHMLRIRRAIGAVKMKEYNNQVMCDTVEHVLRCVLTILEDFDEKFFEEEFSV